MNRLVIITLTLIGLLCAAPFIDILSPSDNIILANITEGGAKILARGTLTLYYQWQIWVYLVIAFLIIVISGTLISEWLAEISDKELQNKKQALDKSKTNFEHQTKQKIEKDFADWEHQLSQRENQLENWRINLIHQGHALETKVKQFKIEQNHAEKKNTGALRQKQQVLKQKHLLIEYLDSGVWKIGDNKMTYQKLITLAKEHQKTKQP